MADYRAMRSSLAQSLMLTLRLLYGSQAPLRLTGHVKRSLFYNVDQIVLRLNLLCTCTCYGAATIARLSFDNCNMQTERKLYYDRYCIHVGTSSLQTFEVGYRTHYIVHRLRIALQILLNVPFWGIPRLCSTNVRVPWYICK